MKRIFAVLALGLLFLAGPAQAQQGNTVTIRFPGAPSGGCAPLSLGINSATGALYDCVAGVWTLVGSPGGGALPAGSGTEVQIRASATTFGAVTNSSFSGGVLTFSNNGAAITGNGYVVIKGDGAGSNLALLDVIAPDFNSYAQCWGNSGTPQRWCSYVNDAGGAEGGWLVITPLNSAGGMSVVSAIETTTFYGGQYRSSSATDPADTGLFRLANAEAGLCAEANPTGTDSCITYSTANAWQAGGVNLTRTVASGAKALATGAIASATCTTAQTDTATGTLTTDTIDATLNGDPTGVTGYAPTVDGTLQIYPYPTADTVNFKVCNNTLNSITPGAITVNWKVTR